ncbi:MAG: aldehyde dehydrogenase family protein [Halobacteriovoraceae bacterium]|nr:aldehyde dehydrogenase family protein [Halobacteriovoraceae bacterium]
MDDIKVVNPFDLKTIEKLKYISESQLTKHIDDARGIVADKKKWIPKYERIEILKNLKELIIKNKQDLVQTAVLEGGKPFKDSLVEIERGVEGVDIAMEELKSLAGSEIPMNISRSSSQRMAITFHRPRGMVTAISAFNHPFNLIIHQVIPAVAAGCPVLVKPALSTPLSCRNIVELLYQAGLDKKYCRMVLCPDNLAQKLVENPGNSFLSFIGSGKVGWFLRSRLPAGAHCALEHGGVAPVIVDETADLENCIEAVVKGGYYHAGQVCVSVQRIYVQQSIKEKFVEKFLQGVKKLKTADPLKKDTDVGPLIMPREVDRVDKWVKEAIDKGASCKLGGKKISDTLYAPTVLMDVPPNSTIARNEIFGPVTIIQGYKDFSEAIDRANNVDYAFQAGVFTKNLDRAMQAAQSLEGLAIMINDHTAFRVDWMPFGGYKKSGLGVGGIGHTIKDLSIEKMVVIKSADL